MTECKVDQDAMVQLLEKEIMELAGIKEGKLATEQIIEHIKQATGNVLTHLKEQSKKDAEVKEAFEENLVRILEGVDNARIAYLGRKGLTAKKKLRSTPEEGFGNDVRIVYGGRGGVNEKKRLSIDIGLQTFVTAMAENGDTFYFGEDLWRFMCHVNREKSRMQSQTDKRLDNLESVKEARGKIEEKLQVLQQFPLSEEVWDAWVKDLNKPHEEVGKLKEEEGYKDEEL
ncbi:hypothetical protein HDU96_001388 [Phlyctochytrium bullatum]|nr:hypothetical protein HDU96_001388 [Phlyctochytrium bullatum]